MWCTLLALVLAAGDTCALAGGGQRYGDYGAVKMPLYGNGEYDSQSNLSDAAAGVDAHDYHSPDAPAPSDYKYEEEPKGNDKMSDKLSMSDKEVETADEWQKPVRKQRKRTRIDNDGYSELLDKRNQDDFLPKLKSSYRFTKHRSRHKAPKLVKDPYSRGVHDLKNYNDESNDMEKDDEFNSDKTLPENHRDMDEDHKYFNRDATDRIIKRKPRDKERPVPTDKRLKEDYESEVDFRRDMMLGRRPETDRHRPLTDDSDDLRHLFELERLRPRGSDTDDRPRMAGPERTRRPDIDTYETRPAPKPIRGKAKTDSGEYDEFYDMKRVLEIKNKLPDLTRRTKARGAAPRPPEELDDLLTNRRVMQHEQSAQSESITTSTTSSSPIDIQEPSSLRVYSLSTQTTDSPTIETTTTQIKEELSLAERSRLSILKKILKKESERNGPPIPKPAVLLQVTKKIPTVVMVEPATRSEPWMRARQVDVDSPARVERAKQLMRHKLVANARNIHDLTDNWDDTVCEYIDVSLLDQMSSAPRGLPRLIDLIIPVQCIVTLCHL